MSKFFPIAKRKKRNKLNSAIKHDRRIKHDKRIRMNAKNALPTVGIKEISRVMGIEPEAARLRIIRDPDKYPPALPRPNKGEHLRFDILQAVEWFRDNGYPKHRFEHLEKMLQSQK